LETADSAEQKIGTRPAAVFARQRYRLLAQRFFRASASRFVRFLISARL
jgi:hypothetical protein